MKGERNKSVLLAAIMVVAVLVLFFLNLCLGTVHIPLKDVIASLTGAGASRASVSLERERIRAMGEIGKAMAKRPVNYYNMNSFGWW